MGEAQTLAKALDILFAIAATGTQLSVSEIASQVNIPESTAYRLLRTLEQNGIVERKIKGKISLGFRILDLARCLYQEMDRELFIIARPIMEGLTEECGETSVLMVRSGIHAVCIQSVESQRAIRFSLPNGRILPLHVSASGKVILAFEDKTVIEQVLAHIGDPGPVARDLETIRQEGCSITVAEIDQDVMGIGVPVYDAYGRIMASLTIAGPVERMQKQDLAALAQTVRQAAGQISGRLQHKEPRQ